MLVVALLGLAGCDRPPTSPERCACAVPAHGVRLCEGETCGPCQCLPFAEPTVDPEPSATFYVHPDGTEGASGSPDDPWGDLDWIALDSALVDGDVLVLFSATSTWSAPVDISRTDDGPYRLVLDGGSGQLDGEGWIAASEGVRATVPGLSTGYDDVARHRVTVRGFEVTGSDDKGIYWRAGDGILLEDLVVHDNDGSPAVSLDYANRTGLPSTGFTLRNSHVFDHRGECVYIGGSEGEDQDSHSELVLERNLIHHCWNPLSSQHDGINVKDRIRGVTVRDNVIFEVDWGIEVASPGRIEGNLVFDVGRNGFHLSDSWGLGLTGLELVDNAVLRPGEDGVYLGAEAQRWQDVGIDGLLVTEAGVAGVIVAASGGLEASLDRVLLVDNAVGMDGWGTASLSVGSCATRGNESEDSGATAGALAACAESELVTEDLEPSAGPDRLWLTDDDPWRQALLAEVPPSQ